MARSTIKLCETYSNTPRNSRWYYRDRFTIYKPSEEYKARAKSGEYTLKYPSKINEHYRPSEELKRKILEIDIFNFRYLRTISYDNFFWALSVDAAVFSYIPRRYRKDKKFLLKCLDISPEIILYLFDDAEIKLAFGGKDGSKNLLKVFEKCKDVYDCIRSLDHWHKPFPHKVQALIIEKMKIDRPDGHWGYLDGYVHSHWSRTSWKKIIEQDAWAIFRSYDKNNLEDSALIDLAIRKDAGVLSAMCMKGTPEEKRKPKSGAHNYRHDCLTLRNVQNAISEYPHLFQSFMASDELNNRQKHRILSKYIDSLDLWAAQKYYKLFNAEQKIFVQLKYGSELDV